MYNKINYLVYGRLVVKSIGYSNNDSLYTYEVRGNFGDLYRLEPEGKPIAIIRFKDDKDTCSIDLKNALYFDYMLDLTEVLKILKTGWTK